MEKRISIKEISEQAQVSIATVSRVINKNGRYSKETEERVLKVIAENGTWCQVLDETTNDVGFILKSLLLRTN